MQLEQIDVNAVYVL